MNPNGPAMDYPAAALAALSGLDLEEVCARLSEAIQPTVPHEWMRICLVPQHENRLQVRFCIFNGVVATSKTALPLNDSLPGEAILAGQPVSRCDLAADAAHPDEVYLRDEYGLRSALVLPLVSNGRTIGTMEIGSRHPAGYSSLSAATAHSLATSAAVVVEHGWRMEESRELARLNERRRLAWELHDGVIQSLTAFALQLELADRYLQSDVPRARLEIQRARDAAGGCLEDARRLVLNLRPPLPGHSTLSGALSRAFSSLQAAGIEVDFSVDGTATPVAADIETALFRFAQEAVANIRKHARPTHVVAILRYVADNVRLTVADDGFGFDPSALFSENRRDGHFGLVGVRERLQFVGGDLCVESAPDRGSTLVADVPIVRADGAVESVDGAGATPPIRVLLADHHAMFREGVRHLLEQAADIEVVGEVEDSNGAVEQVRALRPDLVIVDAQLPTIGGVELVSALSRTTDGTRYLVVSAHGAAELVFRAVKAGAHGYLLKEVAGAVLIESIRTLQRGEMVLHPIARDQPDAGFSSERLLFPQGLTKREVEVLRLIALGLRNKEIALRLSLTENTVKHHVASLLGKLGADSRTEALINAQKLGLITS